MTDTVERLKQSLADRYRLERELGQGGMATVYLAHDLKHDRDVALKVLRPELSALLGRERFLAEVRFTAKLDHPHILSLLDSGESDGYVWYTLPYIRGESLRQKLQRERQLDVAEAMNTARQVAGALEHAHQHGIIHRDVKPENILLHEGEAMLADFGIALAVKEAGGHRLTETGLSIGTPQYMSPEQATAERQLDARSDVYSLGAVLYEMLAGEPPFTGVTAQAVIAKLMVERPTALRTVRDTIPRELDAVVAKALAKTPADRFRTAAAFAEALSGEGWTASHQPPSRSGRRVALLGLVALAGLAPIAWAVFRGASSSGTGTHIDRIALLPITLTSADSGGRELADGLTRETIAALTATGIHVIGHHSVARYGGTASPDFAAIADDLDVGAIATGTVLRSGGKVRVALEMSDPATRENIWARSYDVASDDLPNLAFAIAVDIGSALNGPAGRPARLIAKLDPEAYAQNALGWQQLSRYVPEGFQRALAHFSHALAVDSNYASAHAGMATTYYTLGQYLEVPQDDALRDGEPHASRAMALDPGSAEAHLVAGLLASWSVSQLHLSDSLLARAIELEPSARVLQLAGFVWSRYRGRHAEAVALLERAVRLEPTSGLMHGDLSWRLLEAGDTRRALAESEKARALDPTYGESWLTLALAQARLGRCEEAFSSFDRFVEMYGSRDRAWSMMIGAECGLMDEARRYAQRAEAEGVDDREAPFVAQAYESLGERDRAFAWLERAARSGSPLPYLPGLALLREDSRWSALLRRIGQAP